MDYTSWALDQVKALRPAATQRVWPSVNELVGALHTLRKPTQQSQIFGLAASNLSEDGRPAVEAAILEALGEWRARFDAEADVSSLLDLDKVGRNLGAPSLLVSKRFPLRCDPLGTRDGLSAEWMRRLEKLDEAVACRRTLDARAVHVVGAEDEPPGTSFGPPDEAALYDFVIRWETSSRQAFPRELAALWKTANGVFFDDDPFLAPIQQWSDEDDGWRIGCGGYFQGSLTVAITKNAGLTAAKVVDRDDDGVVRAKYDNIGALVDALLGA